MRNLMRNKILFGTCSAFPVWLWLGDVLFFNSKSEGRAGLQKIFLYSMDPFLINFR